MVAVMAVCDADDIYASRISIAVGGEVGGARVMLGEQSAVG